MDVSVTIGKRQLPNPVGCASGTFGYAREFANLVDLNQLGAIYTKAITPFPRPGNPPPRLQETPSGLLNSIGLANVGVVQFVREKLPYLSQLSVPIIVNVAGFTVEDYLHVIEESHSLEAVWGYEINISCPNTDRGGLAFGTDPSFVEEITRRLRKTTPKPLIVKLTPNVSSISDIARAAEAGGADALSCINTVVGMAVSLPFGKNQRPAFLLGGLSGPAIRPIGVAAVYSVSRTVKIPVIGIGGISSANDALQYLYAGASAIQVGTATFANPLAPQEILKGILAHMKRQSFARITDFHNHLL